MATHRAIFEVTCDDGGRGTDDVTLKLPSTLTRHASLESVTVDATSATALQVLPSVSLNELDDTTGIAVPVSGEGTGIGRQLFFIDGKDLTNVDGQPVVPRRATVTNVGAAPSTDVLAGREVIKTQKVRCELTGGAASGVYTVNMYYETAGDYRF